MASRALQQQFKNIRDDASAGTSKQIHDSKPLLTLIKRLVNFMNTNAESTFLTNSQLLNILQQEFHINIESLHGLEIEIYMNILKKFLKSWPKWDSIEKTVQKSKKGKSDGIEDILLEEYCSLKLYLQEMLTLSKGPTEEALKKLKSEMKRKEKEPAQEETVLDVSCSRSQLNKLFFQQPHPGFNNTIFCLNPDQEQSKISVTAISFEEIFNWPHVILHFDSPVLTFKHKNTLVYKHTLINNALGFKPAPPEISTDALMTSNKGSMIIKKYLITFLQDLSKVFEGNVYSDIVDYVIQLIREDLEKLPNKIYKRTHYKYNLYKFPYVRYLSSKVDTPKVDDKKFSLELQEYLMPAVVFQLINYKAPSPDQVPAMVVDTKWLKVICELCDVTYEGLTSLSDLKQHFLDCHCREPDWTCSHCSKTFSMQLLASNKWNHRC